MSTKLGLDAKLYRNTGDYASPVWEELSDVKDLTLSLEKGEADVSTRGSGGFRLTKGTLKDASIEFQLQHNSETTPTAQRKALRDAFLGNAGLELAVMDGDITTVGTEGLRATFDVLNFSRNENLEESIVYDVTIKPTLAANPPEWMEITV